MFELLASHRRILVTGPQRSGTTIASRMIAYDTGDRCIDESEFGVYDVAAWRQMLELDDVVIQCPHMLKVILDEPRPDALVVLMRRDLDAIHASERRIRWEEVHRGNSAELAVFGLREGSSAEIKYDYWETSAKPPQYLELEYDALRGHPLYVPDAGRVSFGRKDTREAVGSGRVGDGWRSWLASCSHLGLSDEQIRRTSPPAELAPQTVTDELAAMRRHPYYLAAERLGYRVRKLEALLEASRTVARSSSRGLEVDRGPALSEPDFVDGYYSRNRPVVVEGVAEHWSAGGWTPESLAARCAGRLAKTARPHDELDGPRLAQQILTSAFVEAATGTAASGDDYLVADRRVLADPGSQALLAELRPRPAFLGPDDSGSSTYLRLAPAGTFTALHYDVVNVLFVQLMGRQRVLLVSPDQTPLLYNTSGVDSEVDPEAPDPTRHPAFKDCRVAEVVLTPGDALFIPVGWWHHLRTLDVSIAVSFTRFTVDNDFPALRRVAGEPSVTRAGQDDGDAHG